MAGGKRRYHFSGYHGRDPLTSHFSFSSVAERAWQDVRKQGCRGIILCEARPPGGPGTDGHTQGFYLVTPQGKLLECDNTRSADRMKRRLASALKKFDPTDEVPKIEEGRKDPRFTWDLP